MGKAGLREEFKISVLDVFSWERRLALQMEMLNKQADIWV